MVLRCLGVAVAEVHGMITYAGAGAGAGAGGAEVQVQVLRC